MTRAQEKGINLIDRSIRTEESGLDFKVAFAADDEGNDWVLRVPRREDVFKKIDKEKRILDFLIINDLPFDVPDWTVFSKELIGYIKVKGRPVTTTDMSTGDISWSFDPRNVPDAYTISLAKSLAALHRLSSHPNVSNVAEIMSPQELRSSMESRMIKIRNEFTVNEQLWNRWQKWLQNDQLWPEKTVFIHGDLYPGHILISEECSVEGMIDWTESRIDSSGHDFTAHYMLFGEKALDDLIAAYENQGGYTWSFMKEHIIELLSTQAITIAEFGLESGLQEYKNMAQDMLMKD